LQVLVRSFAFFYRIALLTVGQGWFAKNFASFPGDSAKLRPLADARHAPTLARCPHAP